MVPIQFNGHLVDLKVPAKSPLTDRLLSKRHGVCFINKSVSLEHGLKMTEVYFLQVYFSEMVAIVRLLSKSRPWFLFQRKSIVSSLD